MSTANWIIYGAILGLTFTVTTVVAATDGPAMAGFVAMGGAVLAATHAVAYTNRAAWLHDRAHPHHPCGDPGCSDEEDDHR